MTLEKAEVGALGAPKTLSMSGETRELWELSKKNTDLSAALRINWRINWLLEVRPQSVRLRPETMSAVLQHCMQDMERCHHCECTRLYQSDAECKCIF